MKSSRASFVQLTADMCCPTYNQKRIMEHVAVSIDVERVDD